MKPEIRSVFSAVRNFLKTADMLLLALCCAVSACGLVLIYSATRSYGTNSYFQVQLAAVIIGIGLFILFSIIDIDIIVQKWQLLLGFNVLLLLSLLIWGVEGGTGNKSWLRFGSIGVQPSEIVKISFVMLLGYQMNHLRESSHGISSPVSVIQLALHLLLMFGLIIVISSDLGSALVFIAIFIAMCFAGGVNILWFIAGIAAVAAITPYAWSHLLSDYQKQRIMAPYFPEIVDPDGLGITWHANQSKIALASGGFWGQGYMQGAQSQSDALPSKHTDFIFSVAGEEFGEFGCIILIVLLLAIIIRCIYIGLRSRSYMSAVICCGFAAMLAFQTFENIGMCLGLTPVIGLTLPFVSYGGSSMIACFAAMGVVSGIRIRPNPVKHYRSR
mgnify:CR=1 FL=1